MTVWRIVSDDHDSLGEGPGRNSHQRPFWTVTVCVCTNIHVFFKSNYT